MIKPANAKSNEVSADSSGASSRSLFHYTSARGLIGILGTQALFATHANFLNDSSECQLLRGAINPSFD
jgi:hypothetical protein